MDRNTTYGLLQNEMKQIEFLIKRSLYESLFKMNQDLKCKKSNYFYRICRSCFPLIWCTFSSKTLNLSYLYVHILIEGNTFNYILGGFILLN